MNTSRWFLVFGLLLFLSSSHSAKATTSLAEALDATELQWETGGESDWFGQTDVSADSIDAAQSGPVSSVDQTSWISTTVEGPGRLEFDWRIHQTSMQCTYMDYWVDDSSKMWRYVNSDWGHVVDCDIQTGKHKLTWTLYCICSIECDQSTGWLDRVHFLPGGVPPRIVLQPTSQIMTAEGCVDFWVWVEGTEPFSYQWQHNGEVIPGWTFRDLMLCDITLDDTGAYQVVVSNDYGEVVSDIAQLTVIPTYPLDLALGTPGWKWSNSSLTGSWFGQTTDTFERRPTAKSNTQTDGFACLHADVTGPGTLTFAWRLQAESLKDSLELMGGFPYQRLYCNPTTSEWQQQTMYLGNGSQGLTWVHWNASSSSDASAWLADVNLVEGGTSPLITEQPRNSSCLEGSPARFRVKAVGTPPLKYQWRHDGQSLPDETEEVLELRGLRFSNAGLYDVVVTNEYGNTVCQSAELQIKPAPTAPALVFTYVPPWGSKDELLEGMVYNLDPNDYIVAVYIEVYGTWWTKPYWDRPCTAIKDDGSWTCNINTGGSDFVATTISAFVLPKPCDSTNDNPPLLSGQAELPKELFDLAVAAKMVTRSLPSVKFSGYEWFLKSGFWGPGSNHFSHSPQNVWVDEEERLHLKIRRNQGIWKCSEVILADSLGYGTYRFYLDSRVDNPPDNVVVGLFTWSNNPSYSYREIDIEFSRWNEGPDAPDGQFVVQPWSPPGHRYRFHMRPDFVQTVHAFTWEPGQIWFRSLAGKDLVTDPNTENPAEYTFDHSGEIPPPGDETTRINLWLINGDPPGDGKEFELVVKRFEYLPLNFTNYATFANCWLKKGCGEPDWCSGVDLNNSGSVDFVDLGIFTDHWLTGAQ